MELTFGFFELVLQVLLHSLQLPYVLAGVIEVVPQRVRDVFVSFFEGSNVLGVDGDESVFEVLELDIGLLLYSVYLLFQNGDLLEEFSPIRLMLLGHAIDFGEEFFDLVIFEANHLPQAIELNAEDFFLVFLVIFEIFNIEIDHFLELLLHPLKFFILFLHVIVIGLLSLVENSLKPVDLLVLLCADLIHPLSNYVLDCLLLFQRLL